MFHIGLFINLEHEFEDFYILFFIFLFVEKLKVLSALNAIFHKKKKIVIFSIFDTF
jgi:hypothetical protein